MTVLLITCTLLGCLSQPFESVDVDVAEIQITPNAIETSAGVTARFQVLALDGEGNPVPNAPLRWSSVDPSVAVVDSDGTVWSFTSGSTGVTARSKQGSQVKTDASVTVQSASGPRPVEVTDLAVDTVQGTTVRLSFTEIDDGTGQPANYLFRLQIAPFSWETAANVTFGSCGGQVTGTTIDAHRTCTVSNLTGGTTYGFQVIAFKGNLTGGPLFGALSNQVSATTPSTAWIVEDFSAYATIERYLQKTVDGRYRTTGVTPERMALDENNPFGGSLKSLRYDFPDRSASSKRCDGSAVGRALYFPESTREIWTEVWVKFSPNFTTLAPSSWGCTSNPDFKLLFGLVSPDGVGRFQVKVGKFGHSWATGAPDPAAHDVTLDLKSAGYMDGEWHQVRTHWKLGNGDGVVELWVDGTQVYQNSTLRTEAESIWGIKLGANLNQGPAADMAYWWGRVAVWRNRPDWSK